MLMLLLLLVFCCYATLLDRPAWEARGGGQE